jgi:hypothetical protein
MPKLTEGFSPINKPSVENPSILTNLITPVPIHANNQSHGEYFILIIQKYISFLI